MILQIVSGDYMSYTIKQLQAAVKAGESETVEFKTSFDKEAIETLAAFANTKGGTVFVGIADSGEIKGAGIGKETLQNWFNQIKQATAQAIVPDVAILETGGKNVAVLSVAEYPIKPVSCKGRYFKRVKNANHQLTVAEVFNLHLRSFNTSWDYHIDEYHSLKDISLEKVRRFMERANELREVPVKDSPRKSLEKLELVRDGKITLACFLLFMAGESGLSAIGLGRFQTETITKDGAELKTDLFSAVDGVMQFIRKHLNKAYIITGNPQREERWDYPLEAVREIVVNSIIHRDFTSASDALVKIFDDRIEFFNPGKLPDGLTVKMLLKGDYVSNVRNKKIAEIFKSVGLVERYGSGIRRILDGFREYGLPDPVFEELSGGFRVTAYKAKPDDGLIITRQPESQPESQPELQHESQLESMTDKIINLLRSSPLSKSEISAKLKQKAISGQLKLILKEMFAKGLIEFTIPDKPQSRLQKYRLAAKGK